MTPTIFIFFLLIWSLTVVADSPQFSTMVANTAPVELKGTALTIVNCIGFSITIISIQLLNLLQLGGFKMHYMLVLAVGPAFGVLSVGRVMSVGGVR